MRTNTNKYFLKMKFLYENLFYQFCTTDRLSKFVAQQKVFEETKNIFGDIAEFGVFKGNSLSRLIIFREIFAKKKYVYAFDQFGEFKVPKLIFGNDKKKTKSFFKRSWKEISFIKFFKKKFNEKKT